MLSIYTCSFPDECDSCPTVIFFLTAIFLWRGGKKSRAGDAVGRRAKRAGVPEWLLITYLFSKKVRASHGKRAPKEKTANAVFSFGALEKLPARITDKNRKGFHCRVFESEDNLRRLPRFLPQNSIPFSSHSPLHPLYWM